MKSIEIIFCITIAVVVSLVLLMGSQRPINIHFTAEDMKGLCNDAIPYTERAKKEQRNHKETNSEKAQKYKSDPQKETEG